MILILIYVFTFVNVTCTLYWLIAISEVHWNGMLLLLFSCVQLLSHVQLCDLMDCSMPSSSVLHYLTEFAQTHIYQDSGAIKPSHPLTLPSPFAFKLSQHQSFPMSQLFISGSQSIGALALATVLPMNTESWFPLLLTGWISLLSKGLWRVFSNIIVQKH